MITTKFYKYDQVIPKDGKFPEPVRKQISYGEAEKLDDQLCVDLKKLEGTYPSVQARYDEIDAEAVKIATGLEALRVAKSPKFIEVQKKLIEVISKREGVKKNYEHQRTEIKLILESLRRPLVNEKCEEWRQRRITLGQTISIREVEEKPYLENKSDFIIKSNRMALQKVLNFLEEREGELRGMVKNPLREIAGFIKQVESELGEADPTLMAEETMDVTSYRKIREAEGQAKEVDKNPQMAYPAGDGKFVTPQSTEPSRAEKAITSRLEEAKKLFKPILR